jgi:hypothetical protein
MINMLKKTNIYIYVCVYVKIHHRFDLFPAMANTFAWEGSIKTGDLLYVPCMGIHVFESLGPSLGVRFAHQDKHSITCAMDLLAQNSTTIQRENLNYMKGLLSSTIPPDNLSMKPPVNLVELRQELNGLRKKLGQELFDGVRGKDTGIDTKKRMVEDTRTSSSSSSSSSSSTTPNPRKKDTLPPTLNSKTNKEGQSNGNIKDDNTKKFKKKSKTSPPLNVGRFA